MLSTHRKTSVCVKTIPEGSAKLQVQYSAQERRARDFELPESCEQLKPVSPVLLLFPNGRPPAMRAVR